MLLNSVGAERSGKTKIAVVRLNSALSASLLGRTHYCLARREGNTNGQPDGRDPLKGEGKKQGRLNI